MRPFPDVQSGRWQISREGGTRALWSRNGRELFFMSGTAINTNGAALMSASIETAPTFRAGNPTQILPGPYFSGLASRTYDVSADGQRFLMIKVPGQTSTSRPILVVENFFEELRQKVTGK